MVARYRKSGSKKRIMREFTIDELSAVDRPAQGHARATIMKRAEAGEGLGSLLAKRWIDPADGVVSFSEVMQNRINDQRYCEIMEEVGPAINAMETSVRSIAGDGGLTSSAKMEKIRTTVEDFMAAIRTRWPEVEDAMMKEFSGADAGDDNGNEGEDTMKLAELQKQVEDLTKVKADLEKQLEAAKKAAPDADKIAALEKSSEEAKKTIAELTARAEKAEAEKAEEAAKADMSDDEREYMSSMDKEGKAKFMAMSPDERKKSMRKAQEDDETLEVNKKIVRKSVVGAETFEYLKEQKAANDALAKKLDEETKKREEETRKREDAEYSKRAESELEHLPGEVAAKATVLRAIDTMPDAAKKCVSEMLTAGAKAIKAAYVSIGHRSATELDVVKKAEDAYQTGVKGIMDRDKCSKSEAINKMAREQPDVVKAYREATTTPPQAAN